MTEETKEIICECGHVYIDHNIDVCLSLDDHGDYICDCLIGREDVLLNALASERSARILAEGRAEKMEAALEKIIAKTDKWVEEGTVNNPPWWNLGDTAYVALGRKRPVK